MHNRNTNSQTKLIQVHRMFYTSLTHLTWWETQWGDSLWKIKKPATDKTLLKHIHINNNFICQLSIFVSEPTELVWPSILSAVVLTTSFLRVCAPVAVITINITRFILVTMFGTTSVELRLHHTSNILSVWTATIADKSVQSASVHWNLEEQ